ncbi:MAG: hypothetical protein GY748_24200 [Planctomycetaceae bacterium]|nr:hypothetical protein [Planctomycetaceae bacterium]
MSQFASIFVRITLLFAFAIWWGGFTFYASVVVPVGSEILGSSRTQGFITQVVTHWLNVASALTILMLALDLWLNRQARKTFNFVLETGIAIGLLICLATLVFLHPKMDELISLAGETISDEAEFYKIHRVYLWVSTIQWALGGLWMASFMTWISSAKRVST